MLRPSGVYNTDYIQDQAIWRTRVDWFWTIAIMIGLILLPLMSNDGLFLKGLVPTATLGILTTGGILLISITGLNLLLGYTGQISLGQAAFMMVGAYASAVMTKQTGLPFIIALPLAALFAGFIGLIFGLASLRVKGFYLAMATLAAQIMIPWAIRYYSGAWVAERLDDILFQAVLIPTVIIQIILLWQLATRKIALDKFLNNMGRYIGIQVVWGVIIFAASAIGLLDVIGDALRDMNLGGVNGLKEVPSADVLGFKFNTKIEEYYLVLFFVILTATAARNLIRSRLGRAWISIRDNDLAAEQLGINVFRYKLIAFFITAVFAGIAGSLDVHVHGSIGEDSYSLNDSIEQLGMLVIGGAGFPLGPLFGVSFFLFIDRWLVDYARDIMLDIVPQILSSDTTNLEVSLQSGLPPLLFGVFLAIFLIFQPRGIAYRWFILQAAWRLRPFSKA